MDVENEVLIPSQIKPTRSMTHPLCDPKTNGARRRVKQGEPLDPEELSRRLAAHLAEQKLKAERRRDAKAAKAAAAALAQQSTIYHHVPKVAAADFARTTTPDVMRQVHKLSQPVLKQQLEPLNLEDFGHRITSLQKAQAMDQAVIERDLLRNRNQFQWNHDMEEAAEADMERGVYKPPQRTFASEFAHLKSRHDRGTQRPLSTGDFFWEEDEVQVPAKSRPKPVPAYDGRNDWAQREDSQKERRKVKEIASPFLKKKDSIWILKGRKEKVGKQDKDEALMIGNSGPSSEGNRTGRISFLARFKRHPS
jgi:hypothetical protein